MSGHGGNKRLLAQRAGVNAEDILDFSANINPLGPPTWLRSVISRELDSIESYPDPENTVLCEAVSHAWKIDKERLLFGNGANELIYALPRALEIERVIVCPPAYIDYKNATLSAGKDLLELQLKNDFSPDWPRIREQVNKGDLLILAHPNNPSGNLLEKSEVIRLLEDFPEVYVMIDEAFVEFVGMSESFINELYPQLVIMRSFTKFYAIPGLRLGCMITSPEITQQVKGKLCDWSVNTLAQAVGVDAVKDIDFENNSIRTVHENREIFCKDLKCFSHEFEIFPSQVNYLLCRLRKMKAKKLADRLLNEFAIAIRVCDNYPGLNEYHFRIAVKSKEDNQRLVEALDTIFTASAIKMQKRAHPSLMLQGTSSNAGKSLMTAAFCRIMLQDGLKISPFKSQNMALNSFVTHNGLEIARAQVVQAQAARLDPDIRMNPILLKPNGKRLTQVIINGKVVGDMTWAEYVKYKPTAFEEVKKSYDSLCDDFDAVILEGAGSPAEVNLKHSDIVNMGMATYAKSPVLLTGDIDRGGVFASFVGTMDILTPAERKLVSGFLVNRFRGDVSLLQGALDFTLQHTGKHVLAVVPYVANLDLPEEDSLSFRESTNTSSNTKELKVMVIDTPCIANFTDYDPLLIEPDVDFSLAKKASDLKRADLIILPGSKSTMADLAYLRQQGFEEAIKEAHFRGAMVMGICGGFQMLGLEICDPHQVESSQLKMPGLEMLRSITTMAQQKTLKQIEVRYGLTQKTIHGYEIHHGETLNEGSQLVFEHKGDILGLSEERVLGTYLHGIFDNDEFRRTYLNQVRKTKKLSAIESITEYDIEPSLDRLADALRESVDMKQIYHKMGL